MTPRTRHASLVAGLIALLSVGCANSMTSPAPWPMAEQRATTVAADDAPNDAPSEVPEEAPDSAGWFPIQFALFPPIQVVSAQRDIFGLRLGILISRNRDVSGLDINLLSFTDRDTRAIQLGILGNRVLGNASGIQIGTLINRVGGIDPEDMAPQNFMAGIQISALSNLSNIQGIQIGAGNGLNLLSRGGDRFFYGGWVEGAQLGLISHARSLTGVQASALWNGVDGTACGLQLGPINTCSAFSGLQIGVINRAGFLDGIQIGLLNFSPDGFLPVFPIVNFSL